MIKETKIMFGLVRRKLEGKQDKTQQDMETLEHINITCKITGDEHDAWENVPIFVPGPFTEHFNELKKQIQILSLENSVLKNQDGELWSLKQEK